MTQKKRQNNSLPSLLFGDRTAAVEQTAGQIPERLMPILPLHTRYQSLVDDASFMHRAHSVKIKQLELMSAAMTPLEVEVHQSQAPVLIIPIHGAYQAVAKGQVIEARAGQSACLLPASRWTLRTEVVSMLVISLNSLRMERLTQVMLGRLSSKTRHFDWQRPHQLDMQACGLSFDRMFAQLGRMLDGLINQPVLLQQSGLDDMIYRIVAMLLQPDLFAITSTVARAKNNEQPPPLIVVCEYMRDNLHNRIELSDLERVSGMSSRNLQYIFQKQFGCSPMKWMTQQRLEKARKQLRLQTASITVTTVATGLWFSNLGNFSRLYQQQFGELPSETLAQSKTY